MDTIASESPPVSPRPGRCTVILRVILLMILAQGLCGVGKLPLVTSANKPQTSASTYCISSNNNSATSSSASSLSSRQCPYPKIRNQHSHYLDAIYIMYMPQRKQYMEQVVEHYGFADCFDNNIDIIYIPAIHKSSIDKQWFQTKGLVASPFKLGLGKIANHLTLLKTLRLFLYNSETITESNHNNNSNMNDHSWMESRCIIFEDDIAMVASDQLEGWWQHFSKILDDMKQLDWDYVNFGRCYAACKEDDHVTTDIVHYSQAACTHAVGYSYAGALKAMQLYLPLRDRSNDLMIADQITSGQFDGKAYQITPIIFQQNETMGSILTDHGKTWKKPECSDG